MRSFTLSRAAQSDFHQLDKTIQLRIVSALKRFLQNNQGDITRLQGIQPPTYRLRVGDWRICFSYDTPDSLIITAIRHRREAYR